MLSLTHIRRTLSRMPKEAAGVFKKKFLISGSKTRIPKDWKGFLSNNENKTQLIKLIQSEWCKPKYANLLFNHRIFYVCGEECVCISSSDGINVTCTPQMNFLLKKKLTQE